MLFKQQGIVLITILLFLFIFSLIAITGLASSQLELRMSNNLIIQNQMLQAVETGLIKSEQLLLESLNSPCIRDEVAEDVETQPWLVGNSCILSYTSQPVHYVIERQFTDACLITGIGESKQALLNKGDIYRITAWIQQQHYPTMILQTTFAKAKEESCVNPTNELKPGRLSWREITNN